MSGGCGRRRRSCCASPARAPTSWPTRRRRRSRAPSICSSASRSSSSSWAPLRTRVWRGLQSSHGTRRRGWARCDPHSQMSSSRRARGMCMHTPTHAPASPVPFCLSAQRSTFLCSGARAAQCAGDLRRWRSRTVDYGRACRGTRQKRALQGTPHLDDDGALPLALALQVLGGVALARVGPPHRTHRASRVSRGAARGRAAQEGLSSLRETALRGARRGG